MIGNLPRLFTEKMEKLLGDEYDNFMSSYEAPRVYGLRINRLKVSVEAWKQLSEMSPDVRPIPWTQDGLYYKEGERPGKHPHYHAGLYYIQEPSAMTPVELMDIQPGHRVLDLCAAPGGKSTQIAGKLQGKGLLVTNDNAKERTKALAKNIELAGVRNAVVLNEEPIRLAPVFAQFFDRILIDAPCSGEGMFRKDESMIAEWEKHSVERCSLMQRDILRHSAAMLAPGGILVYSTCTFSPEENEEQIAAFLADNQDFHIQAIPQDYGWQAGRADLVRDKEMLDSERLQSLEGTVRLWPHHIEGEGHYVAVLRRDGERGQQAVEGLPGAQTVRVSSSTATSSKALATMTGGSLKRESRNAGKQADKQTNHRDQRREAKRQTKKEWQNAGVERISSKREAAERMAAARSIEEEANPIDLWREQSNQFALNAMDWTGRVVAYGSRIYIQPVELPSLDGLRVVRAGWYVGEAKRGRIEPSHPLAMGLTQEEAVRSVSWSSNDPQTVRFLKGETIFAEEEEILTKEGVPHKGYVLVCADGFPIGWGKYSQGMIKNELPAGWRWM